MARTGFTLIEIVVSISIILLVVTPLYSVFSGSRKAVLAAKELSVAVSLSSSMFAGLGGAPPGTLADLPRTADPDLPGPLGLVVLGISPAPKGYMRWVSLRKLAGRGSSSEPMFRVDVGIEWVSPRHGRTQSYNSSGIVRGRRPS